jgi:hypothetical protein
MTCTRPQAESQKNPLTRGRRPHMTQNDPYVWSGRASQVDFAELAVSGLASMYPAFDWSVAPGHHGYQRACDLIKRQTSIGPVGSPVFACAGKTEPPFRLILSQTSAGKVYRSGYVIAGSSLFTVPVIVSVG